MALSSYAAETNLMHKMVVFYIYSSLYAYTYLLKFLEKKLEAIASYLRRKIEPRLAPTLL